jgi:hypothetical protein
MNQTVTILAGGRGANSQVLWRWKHSDMWIAECPALAQVVQAESWSEMIETIQEVQDSLMRELYKHGELQQFLSSRGWALAGVLPPHPTEQFIPRFDVPFELLHAAEVERRATA